MRLTQKQRLEQMGTENLALRAQLSLVTTERDNALARIEVLVGKPVVQTAQDVLSPYKLAAIKARELAAKTGKPVMVDA